MTKQCTPGYLESEKEDYILVNKWILLANIYSFSAAVINALRFTEKPTREIAKIFVDIGISRTKTATVEEREEIIKTLINGSPEDQNLICISPDELV